MNFIFIFLFVLVASMLSLGGASFVENNNGHTFLIGMSIFFAAVSAIVIIVTFIQQIALPQCVLDEISEATKIKRKIKLFKEQMDDYIKQVSETMTKLYPEFEKEIFKSVSPNNVKDLRTYLAQYPEIKFNSILETHIKNILNLNSNIYEEKAHLEYCYKRLRDLYNGNWMLRKPKLEESLRKEIFD